MDCFNSIIEDIITHLSNDENLNDITFLKEYPTSRKPSPIDKVYVTLGFMGISISKGAFGEFAGTIENKNIYGRPASISLKIKVYSPKAAGGEGCLKAFEKVCSSLVFGGNKYLAESIECKSLDYDLNLTSLTLTSVCKINSFIKSEKAAAESE